MKERTRKRKMTIRADRVRIGDAIHADGEWRQVTSISLQIGYEMERADPTITVTADGWTGALACESDYPVTVRRQYPPPPPPTLGIDAFTL